MKNCKKCGRSLEIYYVEWCPVCDKPDYQNYQVLNVIKALRHIEATTEPDAQPLSGYKNRMWVVFCNTHEFTNDSFITFNYPDHYLKSASHQAKADFKLFMETFALSDKSRVLLEFSW